MKDLKLANFKVIYDNLSSSKVNDKLGVLLITGSYSTGKNKFASSLMRYTQENSLNAQLLSFDLIEMAHLGRNQI